VRGSWYSEVALPSYTVAKKQIPAGDAEEKGEHELTATFYVDNQTQNGKTITYYTDPSGRTRETVSEEGSTKTTVVNHYGGQGEALSWAAESEKWARNIPGIDGSLSAVEKSGEETKPVLQLHDLQGNVVATAAVSETETKVLSTYNSTEFGVPVNGTPSTKYSWLGASGIAAELPSSGATSQGGAGYVPQLGQALQTQGVVPPGAFPDGAYTGAPYTTHLLSAESIAQGLAFGAGAPEREAARQKAKQEEAERIAQAGICTIASCLTVPEPGEGGTEEGGEEGREELGSNEAGLGDPTICVATAFGPTRTKKHHHTLNIRGGYICGGEYADVIGVTVQLCVQEQVSNAWRNAKCRAVETFYGKPSKYFQFTYRCTAGVVYQTWLWLYGFGGVGVLTAAMRFSP
jgi:hypothetical protein